ncbi:hypothetical protein [Iningainema tapete]|uniref:Uncharacterized protein n=1 Tax=Iningainema tapete BLCC-T55 TaxID=2748662 RepID=A0A8J7BWW9_9CYAN|nr:hypothetical protein [Iningainema tapete]MBD2772607.1 hypothetical protein [Iningainema tapete BLCC-T55]
MNHQKVEINNAQLSLLPPDILEQVNSTKTETKLKTSTLQALKLLAAMETNREFLALLLELGEFRADHLRYLMGPLVFHRSPWAETVPDWLKAACIQDRFEIILDEYERDEVGEHATATEILTYMMPATYEAPLHYSYYQIYMWVGNQVMTKHNRLPEGYSNFYEFTGASPIDFDSIKYDYNDLARSIRRSVVRHAAQQGWGKRPARKSSQSVSCQVSPNLAKSPPSTSAANQPSEVQLKLF